MDFPHRRILILASNHVGNNIFCTPGIRFLKKHLPDAKIDIVTLNRRSVDVFAANPDIQKIHIVNRKRALQQLALQFQYVIALHPDKTKDYLQGINIPFAIIPPWSGQKHRGDDVLEFMHSLIGCSITAKDRIYALHSEPKHADEVRNLLKTAEEKTILIGMHLGSGRTAVHGWKIWYRKRDHDPRLWPLQNYIELAKQLTAQNSTIKLVITGSKNEKFLGKKFVKQIPGTINLIGKTSLQTLAALMAKLHLFITPDTGAMHVACATNVSLIGLFGPTEPGLTGPFPLRPQYSLIKKMATAEITPIEVCEIALEKIQDYTLNFPRNLSVWPRK